MKVLKKEASFYQERKQNVLNLARDHTFQSLSKAWMAKSVERKYSYQFDWLGRPIIQYPQDLIAIQEIIWKVKPDLIIETGIARGGSLIFYASLLVLLGGKRKVLGIDIHIRPHNRRAIRRHPLSKKILMIEGSSVDQETLKKVAAIAKHYKKILIILDSNHTHDHVLQELQSYSGFVSRGSYVIVLDTIIEDIPDHMVHDRPWKKGNSPKSAVNVFLKHQSKFQVDRAVDKKLLLTVAPGGYLKKIHA